jgi:putative nucleotidyltransferase with HDIG domain
MDSLIMKPQGSRTTAFLPIYLESLIVDTVLDFDLFIRLGRDMALYRSRRLPFTEQTRLKLIDNRVQVLFVAAAARREYQQYIEGNLASIVQDPKIQENRKASIVYEASKALVKDVLANPGLGENIQRSKNMVSSQVSYILRGRQAFLNLMKISSYDYYTYTHSVNVCTFAVALANQLGMRDRKELWVLGLGALLHDVGKSRISERILNKSAPLNRAEFEIVKKHPVWGQEILKETDLIAEDSYFAVLQHHERVDGSGYPNGLPSDDIHPFGKIVAVCDVFDALTTRRVYQDAMNTYKAFREMYNERHRFDPAILEEFTRLMGPDGDVNSTPIEAENEEKAAV